MVDSTAVAVAELAAVVDALAAPAAPVAGVGPVVVLDVAAGPLVAALLLDALAADAALLVLPLADDADPLPRAPATPELFDEHAASSRSRISGSACQRRAGE